MSYKKILPLGLLCIALNSPLYSTNKEKKGTLEEKKSYTLVVDRGNFSLQEGAGVDLIKNSDTLKMETNYIGMISFNANINDTVIIYPTQKSDNFNSLELILTDKTFNVVMVQPIASDSLYTSSNLKRGFTK